MFNLFLLNETLINELSHLLLDIISLAVILCGIFIIISKNPIMSVLFLIGLFLNIASYLMMLGMNFIGLTILILFLFILMLINVRISKLITNTRNSVPLAILIGIYFNLIIN